MVQRITITNQQTTLVIVAGVTITVTILGTYFYRKHKRTKIPTEWRPVGKIKKMAVYPMKSARRIEVQEAECTERGLIECEKTDKSFRLRDRSFMVYQEGTLECKTARNYNKMVLCEMKAHDEDSVVLNAPGMESLIFKVPTRSTSKEVIIKFFFNEPIYNLDCGDEVAKWISTYLLEKDSGLRLSYNDGSHQRTHVPKIFKELNGYFQRDIRTESAGLNADLAAMSLVGQKSVDDVSGRVDSPAIPVESFRMSLIMDDPTLKAFDENNFMWVKVGDVVMKNVMDCLRCVMTTINMETGVRRADREPLKTMLKYRLSKSPQKDPIMGIYLEVFKTGKISVGDTVYVGEF